MTQSNIFQAALGVEVDSKLTQSESQAPDFKEYEIQIAGLTLSETLEGKAPTIDFLTVDHFQERFLAAVYLYCLQSYEQSGRVSKQGIIQTLLDGKQDNFSMLGNFMIEASMTKPSIIKQNTFEIDEHHKVTQAREILRKQLDIMNGNLAFSEYSKQLDDMSVQLSQVMYHQVEKTSYSYDEGIKAFEENFYSEEAQSLKTGLKDLDEVLNGFGRGELIICAARPGMGKTALMIHLLANIAEQGHHCLCFNLEMTNDQNQSRFMSREMVKTLNQKMPYKDIQKAMNGKDKAKPLYRAAFDVMKHNVKPIHNNYNQSLNINQIVSYAERHAQYLQRQGKRLDFIAIDYLQIISMTGKRDAHLEIGDMTGKLKQLAKRLSVPVLVLSQLNRSLEAEHKKIEDKKPQLHHLRQSGKIEEDADKIIFPFRPNYYERELELKYQQYTQDYMQVIIAKNRSGENCIVPVVADMATNYFSDAENKNWLGRTNNASK